MIPDNSNWITENLIVGGLLRNKNDFDMIKNNGITIFVNLMCSKEAQRGKKKPLFDYRDSKNHKGIEYLHYPTKDLYILPDKEIIKIANKIVTKINQGNKVYIHCYGGHGRTGTLTGIVLHFLYPKLTYTDILKQLQTSHRKRKYKPNQSTPQTAIQFNQLHRIITGKDDIFFYLGESDPNFIFSNYYQNKNNTTLFEILNQNWKSNEAFFQAGKYTDKKYKFFIQDADTAHKAFLLGRMGGNIRPAWVVNKNNNKTKILDIVNKNKKYIKLIEDWDDIRDVVMIIGLFAKFTQNKDLYDKLLSTGNSKIVEYSPVDKYWGTYWNIKGQNKLGKYLMKIRKCLKLDSRENMAKISKQLNYNDYKLTNEK